MKSPVDQKDNPNTASQTATPKKVLEKKDAHAPLTKKFIEQINNERIFRDPANVQLAQIKTLDALISELQKSPKKEKEEILEILETHHKENEESFVARYVTHMLGLADQKKGSPALLELLSQYVKTAKWAIAEHIATIILEVEENNRFALRAKIDSMERLRSKDQIKPFLAKLAEIDRKNPDILQKYAHAIVETEPQNALKLFKQAAEICALMKDYSQLENLWELIVRKDHKDLTFFERIERIVVGNRDRLWMASQLIILLEPYRAAADWQTVIFLLKKVLQYEPNSTRARSDLVRAYREIYADHSLLNEFLKVSELTNHKKAVEACVASFERNIVFDKDNFVFHRTRGVGKVREINKDFMIIDFSKNENQRMTLKMAINSLYPLEKDHIWVEYYEDSAKVQERFESDIPAFFENLLRSYKGKILIPELKQEISKRFLTPVAWAKWWTKARAQLKKDPRFSFNPRKKDELILREIPMTFAEELAIRFQNETRWSKKMELAVSILKEQDVENALVGCLQYFVEHIKTKDMIRKIQSYVFLESVRSEYPILLQNISITKQALDNLFQEASPEDLIQAYISTGITDIRREIMQFTRNLRKDYPVILQGMLFDNSIKTHRLIINELIQSGDQKTLEEFASTLFSRYRDNPEVFLWLARQILVEDAKPEWVKRSKEELFLLIMRLLPSLANIEKQGNKLKKQAMEIVTGNFHTVTIESLLQHPLLVQIIKGVTADMLRRMISLFDEIPYVAHAHKENFEAMIAQIRPDYQAEATEEKEARLLTFLPQEGEVLISESAYKQRKELMDKLVNVEIPKNSKDIGEAQERGDLRENSEYQAALERQSQLRNEIETLAAEIRKAKIIAKEDVQTDIITIGTKVYLSGNKEDIAYTILGPWDVDTKANIISYEARLARALLGKKMEDEIVLDKARTYRVKKIVSSFD